MPAENASCLPSQKFAQRAAERVGLLKDRTVARRREPGVARAADVRAEPARRIKKSGHLLLAADPPRRRLDLMRERPQLRRRERLAGERVAFAGAASQRLAHIAH